ncbi:MAG TPA: hypothetical protein DDW52_12965, partial [Planctomycetaceae bacterium]|nr:hypothetical protein [Planctomycetaceae bacterium]
MLHLLNRHKHRRIDWPATRLLSEAVSTSRRTFHWEQLLLLAMRVAIPILLAFCLARPTISGASMRSASNSLSLVVVLDNSLSMASKSGAGQTRYELARSRLRSMLDELSQSSMNVDVALFSTTSDSPIVQRTTDLTRIAEAIETLPINTARSRATETMTAARVYALRSQRPAKALWVASDLQKATWTKYVGLRRETDAEESGELKTVLLDCGLSGSNCFFEQVNLPQRTLVGRNFRISGNWNSSEHLSRSAPAHCTVSVAVDGKQNFSERIARGDEFECQHSFERPGPHEVIVDLNPDSESVGADIYEDNRQYFVIDAQMPTRVLLVLSPGIEKCLSYLTSALEPFDQEVVGIANSADNSETRSTLSPNGFQITQVNAEALDEQDFESAKILILAADAEFRDPAKTALKRFVSNSGGVLLFPPGDRPAPNDLLELLGAPSQYSQATDAPGIPESTGLVFGGSLAESGLQQFSAELLT